jgi:hypothetical protein
MKVVGLVVQQITLTFAKLWKIFNESELKALFHA